MSDQKPVPSQVFTPGAPINSGDFFLGRISQIQRIVEAFNSDGRHPIVFGQRGVGKTSLANIVQEKIAGVRFAKITCDSSDTYEEMWRRLFSRITISHEVVPFGLAGAIRREAEFYPLSDLMPAKATPSSIADVLSQLTGKWVFIFDEFDRVAEGAARGQIADLVKNLSDNRIDSTLMLVGVGKNISALIGDHPSIARNLVQVEMPEMPEVEIREIVSKGFSRLGLLIGNDVLEEIARMAHGLPHYAHLLGLAAAKAASGPSGRKPLDRKMFLSTGCRFAIEDALQTFRDAFSVAIKTEGSQEKYARILCACGLVKNSEGVFRASDVIDAVNSHFGEVLSIQAIISALQKFSDPSRGPVLEKVVEGRFTRYKFKDHMMRPFLCIRAKLIK